MRPLYLWLSLKNLFMGWGGFSLSLPDWVLSHSNIVHTHKIPPTHTLACGETVVAVSFVSVASGSASGSCSEGASGWLCLVIREPEPDSRHRAPLTWPSPANHKHFIWYSVVSHAEGTACVYVSSHWLEILSVFKFLTLPPFSDLTMSLKGKGGLLKCAAAVLSVCAHKREKRKGEK